MNWTYDTLAAIWSSPLIVGDKVFVADEDGDVAVFWLSADPKIAMPGGAPLAEINMGNSVYCSPIYAHGTLFVASKDHLFAIQNEGADAAGYWPQWRGPNRDNISADWDLLQEWPEEGPPLKWRTNGIGEGIASVSVADGTIYTLGSAGGHEHVIALHERTGEQRWRVAIGPAINDAPLMRWLSQRTPTIDGDRVYASSAQGDLICLQTADGKEVWRKNYLNDFGSLRRTWGFVDRPLGDGENLICMPGGTEATIAALNKRSDKVVWMCLLDPPEAGSYPALMKAEIRGLRQYIAILKDSLFCYDVRASTVRKAVAPLVVNLANPTRPPAIADRSLVKNKQPDAIFVPTPLDVVAKMLGLADVKKDDVVYDLGSGDGRIVIAAAKTYGAKAVGIELDRRVAEQSQDNVKQAGVGELVRIEYADIFKQDLSHADVVALYIPPNLMDRLLPQFEKLKPGARIVCHYFKFRDIAPEKSLRYDSRDDGDVHEIYLWTVPLHKTSR